MVRARFDMSYNPYHRPEREDDEWSYEQTDEQNPMNHYEAYSRQAPLEEDEPHQPYIPPAGASYREPVEPPPPSQGFLTTTQEDDRRPSFSSELEHPQSYQPYQNQWVVEDDENLLKPRVPVAGTNYADDFDNESSVFANRPAFLSAEYADDPFGDVQIPIRGDTYKLNTWEDSDPTEQSLGLGSEDEGIQREPTKGRKKLDLVDGNLVLDCPVSKKLLAEYPPHEAAREFTHMRYSAATCDPINYSLDRFTLRPKCYVRPRQTELLVAITIYNEDDVLLARTLQGVFNNIRHLCTRSHSSTWGADAWKKVVVCIIADGRTKLNPRSKALMAALGVYQDGLAKNVVNDRPVEGHIYEYTTMMRIKKVTDVVTLTSENATPVQMMFCLKEKNKKKINSHRWLFQAFGPVLNPNVVVLLDAGTRPGNKAIYHLWKRFDRNPNVAGACGEIAAMLGKGWSKLVNPLVAAQNFEYKMSNILDKPCESVFGFITVLPGAFSAYRYVALQNDERGIGPLEKYFKGEVLEATGGIFESNMYLAEDRILCWELVAKPRAKWILTYVKSAVAHTDVPETLTELILQRRRWLNGSFFAGVYAQVKQLQIWRTDHSIMHKLMFQIEFFYQTVSLVFSWFSLANFFLVFKILANSLSDKSVGFAPGKVLGIIFTWFYAACVIATFVLSLGNKPQGSRGFYLAIVIFFAIMMLYVMFAAIFIAVKSAMYASCIEGGFQFKLFFTNRTFRDLLISLLATYLLYFISSLIMLDPWHCLTSMIQYVMLSPTYVNVFNVYAFCNTHDISWGTKGDTGVKHDLGVVSANEDGKVEVDIPVSAQEIDDSYLGELQVLESPLVEEKQEQSDSEKRTNYYATFRSLVVLFWGFMNIALIAVVLNVNSPEHASSSSTTDTTAAGTDAGTAGAGTGAGTGAAVARRAMIYLAKRADGQCTEIITTSSKTVSTYLAVILWSVAIMAAFKFIVTLIYVCGRVSFRLSCCGNRKR